MGETGPEPDVTVQDILDIFQSQEDYCEPRTAREIAEEVEVTRRTALKRLERAEQETEIASKKVGGRARVWWIPHSDNCD